MPANTQSRRMRATLVRFGPQLYEELQEEAAVAGVSVSQYVREAVVARIAYTAGQADDRHLVDPALAQERLQPGGLKARVALGLRIGALVDDDVDAVARHRVVQLGARRPGHAVRRPRPAVLGERAMIGRVPVARG